MKAYKFGPWPTIRRYACPEFGDAYVWGVFMTRNSRKPCCLASDVRSLGCCRVFRRSTTRSTT